MSQCLLSGSERLKHCQMDSENNHDKLDIEVGTWTDRDSIHRGCKIRKQNKQYPEDGW